MVKLCHSVSVATDSKANADKHLWEFRWVRDLALLVVVVLLCYLVYKVRTITLPVVIAFALAYVFNPFVTWAAKVRKVPRWATTAGLMSLLVLGTVIIFVAVVPSLIEQTINFVRNTPQYVKSLNEMTGIDLDETIQGVRDWLAPKTEKNL